VSDRRVSVGVTGFRGPVCRMRLRPSRVPAAAALVDLFGGHVGPANLLDGAEAGWLQVVLPTTTIAEAETVLCGYGVRRVRRQIQVRVVDGTAGRLPGSAQWHGAPQRLVRSPCAPGSRRKVHAVLAKQGVQVPVSDL